MLSYTHFTLSERKYLQELLSEGKSFRKIADALGRNVSSVSREVNRNRSKYPPKKKSNNAFNYHHWRAETLSIMRRRVQRQTALIAGTHKYNYVIAGLQSYWSPEQISERLRRDYPGEIVGVSTIYRYLKRNELPTVSVKKNLRRRGKRKVSRNACYNTIQPERIIPQWPEEIRNRSRTGDWEGDTVYGGVGKGLVLTLVDRRHRQLCAKRLLHRDALETEAAIVEALKGKKAESISLDNGSEFSEFHKLEEDLHTLVYFAEPHKPWQRGTNENTNDLLRFFFPKGYDFRTLTDEELQEVVELINNRPRKCLGWLTPNESFQKSVALG